MFGLIYSSSFIERDKLQLVIAHHKNHVAINFYVTQLFTQPE